MRLQELHVNAIDLNKFETDCKPFLEAIKGSYHVPWHGTDNAPTDWKKEKMAGDREPRDTPNDIHDWLNDFFHDKYSWRAREVSIFTTGLVPAAKMYGDLCVIIPVGSFQSLWSPDVTDIMESYDTFKREARHAKHMTDSTEIARYAREQFKKFVAEKADWNYNVKLKEGYKSHNEVILNSSEFYIFNHVKTWNDSVRPFLIKKGYLVATQ